MPLGHLFNTDLDVSDLSSNPMANLGLSEQTNTSVNELLDARQLGLLIALPTDHEAVDTVLYIVGQLSQLPGPDLVLNVKLVRRRVGDLLERTLHALELGLEEPDLPLHTLLQLELADEQFAELGDDARQCPCRHLHCRIWLWAQGATLQCGCESSSELYWRMELIEVVLN